MGNCWGGFLGPGAHVHSAATSGSVTKSDKDGKNWHSTEAASSSSSSYGAKEARRSARPKGEILPSEKVKVFTFSELKTATRNFRPENLLGEGGFGSVFKGWIGVENKASASGALVAVKRLNNESVQGLKEWLAEVNYLGQLSHPNLVKLMGYCSEDDRLLLVYEFMTRGSLENHLFRRGSSHQPLPWNTRIKIAVGAARGLEFLHAANPPIIYRDFKTSNILLDSNYDAKLSDFGLATDGPTGTRSHVTTTIMGTYGYAAPEYMATGHLTARSDVYSFGVVLLEVISGLRAFDPNRPTGQQDLVKWAKFLLVDKRKIYRFVDSRLNGQYPSKAAYKAAILAFECLNTDAKQRPLMREVVERLELISDAKEKERHRPRHRSSNPGRYTLR